MADPCVVSERTFYVATYGSDSNPGDVNAPFATLERARQTVDAINESMTGNIVVSIRGGVYELPAPTAGKPASLTLGPSDSGFNGCRVVYRAYPGEQPILSGGRKIPSSSWTLHDVTKGIWKAALPASVTTARQLFVNGVRAQRARSSGGIPGCALTTTGYSTTVTSASDPKAPRNWTSPSEVELVYSSVGQPHSEQRCRALWADPSGSGRITMQQDCFAGGYVTWTNALGVTVSGDTGQGTTITKTGPWGYDNAGAVSTQAIGTAWGAGNGYVELRPLATNKGFMFGLNHDDVAPAYWDIDYAMYVGDGGWLGVHENGVMKTDVPWTTYAAGDHLRVEVKDGIVKYEKYNPTTQTFNTFYTSTVTPTYPLYVDTWLGTAGTVVSGTVIRFGDTTPGKACPTTIENAYGELDEAGEWVLANGIIYYIPRAGEVMSSAETIVPTVEQLVSIEGLSVSSLAHDVTIDGLTFRYAAWNAPNGSAGFLEVQANWYVPHLGSNGDFPLAAVTARLAKNLTFSRDTFERLGGQGLVLDYGVQDSVVLGNAVADVSATGIRVGRDDYSAAGAAQTRNVHVDDNFVHHVGVDYRGSVGIHVMYAADTVVTHNEIAHLPYSGISLGWGWGNDAATYANHNEISANFIHDVMLFLVDGGAIYTLGHQPPGWGASGTGQGNYVPPGIPRSTIRDNNIQNQANNYGAIYLDQGSTAFDVTGNVISLAPRWFYNWNPQNHDISVTGNYADVTAYENRPGECPTNQNLCACNPGPLSCAQCPNCGVPASNQSGLIDWPSAARATMTAAGLEPTYRDVGAPRAGRDLAARSTAIASSQWSTQFDPSNVLDGRPMTSWASASGDPAPRLTIDLGANQRLSAIDLVTRQEFDQPGTRRNFEVWAWSDGETSAQHVVLGAVESSALPYQATWTLGVGNPTPFRYVAIAKTDGSQLVVAELRVWGADRDLALGRPATASTEVSGKSAGNAVDGTKSTEWQSVASSGTASWSVDLGTSIQLRQIQLDLSADTTLPEMRQSFEVWGANEANLSDKVVLGTQGGTPLAAGATFTVGVQTMTFRYVAVMKTVPGQRLGLAAARLYGAPPNRALWGIATAGSSQAGYDAANAIDGSILTGWVSIAASWGWQVSLQGSYVLSSIRLTGNITTAGPNPGPFEIWASPYPDMSFGHTVLAHVGSMRLSSPWGITIPISDPRPYGFVALVYSAVGANVGEVEVFPESTAP